MTLWWGNETRSSCLLLTVILTCRYFHLIVKGWAGRRNCRLPSKIRAELLLHPAGNYESHNTSTSNHLTSWLFQVKPLPVICSSPSSSSSSPSSPSSRVTAAAHLPASTHTQSRPGLVHPPPPPHTHCLTFAARMTIISPPPVAMMIPAASPWLVNELGEALCSVVAPPPYSYDPNGSDLPRGPFVLFVHLISNSPISLISAPSMICKFLPVSKTTSVSCILH